MPIVVVLFGFQLLILKQKIKQINNIILGFLCAWIGLSLFIIGLEKSLFPLGKLMAEQLTSTEFISNNANSLGYIWVYIFAASIGFATTIAEPSLLAVAMKAQQVSKGVIKTWPLRIVVAIGVALGVAIGRYRIVGGTDLHYFIISGYVIVLIQTYFSPKNIIALARQEYVSFYFILD